MAQTVRPNTSLPDGRRGSEKRYARKPCQSTATRGASRLRTLGQSQSGIECSADCKGIPFHGTRFGGGMASLPGSRRDRLKHEDQLTNRWNSSRCPGVYLVSTGSERLTRQLHDRSDSMGRLRRDCSRGGNRSLIRCQKESIKGTCLVDQVPVCSRGF